MKTESYILPEFWASALINGDFSGYTDEEIDEISRFLNKVTGSAVSVSDEPYFSRYNDAKTLACNVLEYTFVKH
jgi:hypothetical protein